MRYPEALLLILPNFRAHILPFHAAVIYPSSVYASRLGNKIAS